MCLFDSYFILRKGYKNPQGWDRASQGLKNGEKIPPPPYKGVGGSEIEISKTLKIKIIDRIII